MLSLLVFGQETLSQFLKKLQNFLIEKNDDRGMYGVFSDVTTECVAQV